jgi:hypothetical protein
VCVCVCACACYSALRFFLEMRIPTRDSNELNIASHIAQDAGFETVECKYVSKETTNRRMGVCVPRVFVQAKFRAV